MTDTNQRLCAFCKHFYIEAGCGDTYGHGGEDYPECKKGQWEKLGTSFFTFHSGDESGFREMLKTARRCKLYDETEDA